MDVEALVGPVIESAGLRLWDLRWGRESGRRVLRVVVDREGGVDLDAIAAVSERISRRLDLEGFAPGPYELEVSSPGLERTLREPGHFRRTLGERVKVRTAMPIGGTRSHQGTLASADEREIVLATDGGEVRIAYAEVTSARTVIDWSTGLEPDAARAARVAADSGEKKQKRKRSKP
jgi:ribosome maturation factor RimP